MKKTFSSVRFQLVQESAPTARFDAWGQIEARYEPGELDQHLVTRALKALESRSAVLPWSELEQVFDPSELREIEGSGITENMTTGGLLVDGKLYTLPCKTRFGKLSVLPRASPRGVLRFQVDRRPGFDAASRPEVRRRGVR